MSAPELLAWLLRVYQRVQADTELPEAARTWISWEIGKACGLLSLGIALEPGMDQDAARLTLAPAGEPAPSSPLRELTGELRELEAAWLMFLRHPVAA